MTKAASAAHLLAWPAAAGTIAWLWSTWPAGSPRRWPVLASVALVSAAALAWPGRARLGDGWRRGAGRLHAGVQVTCGVVVTVAVCAILVRWPDVTGAWFLLGCGVAIAAIACGVAWAIASLRRSPAASRRLAAGAAAATVLLLTLILMGVEVVLAVGAARRVAGADSALFAEARTVAAEYGVDPETVNRAIDRSMQVVMPDSWRYQAVEVPGAARAYLWQGALHAQDEMGVRLQEGAPGARFPAGTTGARRPPVILVVGDSCTFGLGIETRDRFTERLESILTERGTPVSVVNRGVCSDQSADILAKLPHGLDVVHPDLVVYAICQNDFLPSGTNVYDNTWHLPEWLARRAHLLELADRGLLQLQLAVGASPDFHTDIVRDLDHCQVRFAHDVAEMNRLVTSRGLPPMVALPLDQIPTQGGPGERITRIAEEACRAAGMRVVDTSVFYKRLSGSQLVVSRWECHPNEIANGIWGKLLADELEPLLSAAGAAQRPTESSSRAERAP